MKYKIIEAVRQILRKIILPLRKKKEEWLGNFRFSILFRISLHYVKLLIISGIIFMAGFSILYYVSEWRECENKSEDIIVNFINADHSYYKQNVDNNQAENNNIDQNASQKTSSETASKETASQGNANTINIDNESTDQSQDKSNEDMNNNDTIDYICSDKYSEYLNNSQINRYIRDGITLKILDQNNIEVYNDMTYDITSKKKIFNKIYYKEIRDDLPEILIIFEEKKIVTDAGDTNYTAYFQYDLSNRAGTFHWLLSMLIILYIVLIFFVMNKGRKEDKGLFQPINDMSSLANRLTVNNLHSERINVEGTKNELKDLATVINSMLDRIETSYESQKQFVSDASHELRTPIAVIQGYANLLKRWGTKDEDVLLESIEAINNESKAMQDLVEKLLFLSRHDKKTLKLVKRRFNMCAVVEDMVKETRLVTSNRIIESPVMEYVVVYGDQQALKQAIRVFIDNAVKYTRDGDTITICCKNANGDCVITVADTGIGIRKKDAEHIFERFYRSDHVRDQKIYGHGLGLSIAKLIILAHTGKIKVRSQFTKGTTFTITLPRRRH